MKLMKNKVFQKRKISAGELKKKAKTTKEIIRGIINETIKLPNNAIIFDPEVLLEIFTRKRLELIQYINSCKPQSIQELAELTGRKKQAVFRDLKILERNELVKLIKKGKTVIPTVQRKMVILNLRELFSLEVPKSALCKTGKSSKKLNAQVYVNQKNVNQVIGA